MLLSSARVHDDNALPSHECILDVPQIECWKNDARDLLPQLRFTRRGFVRYGEDSCELMGDSRAGTVHEPPLVLVEQTRRHLSLQLLQCSKNRILLSIEAKCDGCRQDGTVGCENLVPVVIVFAPAGE